MSESRGSWQGKTFKSGNSVALRLPKGLGVAEGVAVTIVREGATDFRVELAGAPRRKVDVSKFAGKAPWLQPLPAGSRDFEERPSARVAREATASSSKTHGGD